MGGFPPQIVVGRLLTPGAKLIPRSFARNPVLVDFMHDVIQNTVPQIEEFAADAKRNGTGWLNIHDARAWNVDRDLAAGQSALVARRSALLA